MYKLGLIGSPLSHSYSKKYFDKKFKQTNEYNFKYSLYELESIQDIDNLINHEQLIGFNVTRPYKTSIMDYLDSTDEEARITNAVNTVFINPNTKMKFGFNTDIIGFQNTLETIKIYNKKKALILGSGSVSSTIKYVLKKKGFIYKIVSRNPKKNMLDYQELQKYIQDYKLLINTTPLGQYPYINFYPDIPYQLLSSEHYCVDLIYNPEKTTFLKKAEKQNSKIINGLDMLISQAEAAWEIWLKMIKLHNV